MAAVSRPRGVRRRSNKPKTLPPVHPNAGLQVAYRRRMMALVDEMFADTRATVMKVYAHNEPKIAQDATPATVLQQAIRRMVGRWQKRFDLAAPAIASWFTKDVTERTDAGLQRALRQGGISVRFQMTPAVEDVAAATVHQNVQLIKSIPQQFLGEVEGMVMRSVQTGRDLHQLTTDLTERYGITKRRAANIARSQNNMATAAINRTRQKELGITQALWLHSHGGREPRKTHLANDGKPYNPAEGWFDPDPKVQKRVWPGELPNCRCTSRSIIAGFS